MTGDEKFFAWLDGELSGAEAAEMAARVASDPALAALAEQHRAMQARLTSGFERVSAGPVPEYLQRAVSQESNVVDLSKRREQRRQRFPSLPQWATTAATLVAGVLFGTLIAGQADAPIRMEKGAIYASGELGHALDVQLASAPSGGPVRIGITFRNSSGSICRSFTGDQASGLACRHERKWQVKGLFPATEGQGGDYRMASGTDPNLAALIDSMMADEPMDAVQEAAAKDRNWR